MSGLHGIYTQRSGIKEESVAMKISLSRFSLSVFLGKYLHLNKVDRMRQPRLFEYETGIRRVK